jgi:hypothetical protein
MASVNDNRTLALLIGYLPWPNPFVCLNSQQGAVVLAAALAVTATVKLSSEQRDG